MPVPNIGRRPFRVMSRQASGGRLAGALAVLLAAGLLPVWTAGTATAAPDPTATTTPAASIASAAAAAPTVTAPAIGAFQPVGPLRVLDTRSGLGARQGAVGADAGLAFDVRAVMTGAPLGAVVMDVTVVSPAAAGTVVASPDGLDKAPGITFDKGQTVTGLVTAPVGADGTVVLWNHSTSGVQLVVDAFGTTAGVDPSDPRWDPNWNTPRPVVAGAYGSTGPVDILDTRTGLGGRKAALTNGATVAVPVLGVGGVPASGVSAVAVSLTAVSPTAAGTVTVYPGAAARPAVVSASFDKAHSATSPVVVPVGKDGRIQFTATTTGSVQLAAAVTGYFLSGAAVPGGFTPVTAQRLVDSAKNVGHSGAVKSSETVSVAVTGRAGVPATGVAAVEVAVTTSGPTGSGNISAGASGASTAPVPRVYYSSGRTATNLAVVAVGADGKILLRNSYGPSVQVGVDVVGWYRSVPAVGTWSAPQRIDGNGQAFVSGLSCVSSSFCFLAAAADYSTWNGSAWSTPRSYPGFFPYQPVVSCISTTFCALADLDGMLRIWNGKTFAATAVPDVQFTGVSCVTAAFCTAVTVDGVAYRWNGSAWGDGVAATSGFALEVSNTAISCTSPTFCMVVDTNGRSARWDGRSWHASNFAIDDGWGDYSVSCVGTAFCMSVGSSGARRYASGKWSTPSPVDTVPMGGVSCTTTTQCAAIDDSGQVLAYDGTTWTAPATLLPTSSYGTGEDIACGAGGWCAAVNHDGFAAVRSGGRWGPAVAADTSGQLVSVSCPTADFCAALDITGQVLFRSGTSWSRPVLADDSGRAGDISCVSATFCVALGKFGQVRIWNGSTWRSGPSAGDGQGLFDNIECVTTTWCLAVGETGQFLDPVSQVFDGKNWSHTAAIATYRTQFLSCPAVQNCFLAADRAVERYNGTSWTLSADITRASGLSGLGCGSSAFCAALDTDGYTMIWNGSRWSAPTSSLAPGFGAGVRAFSCAKGTTFCAAASGSVDDNSLATSTGGVWHLDTEFRTADVANALSCGAAANCVAAGTLGSVSRLTAG